MENTKPVSTVSEWLKHLGIEKKCQVVKHERKCIEVLYKDSMILRFTMLNGKLQMEGIPIKQPCLF